MEDLILYLKTELEHEKSIKSICEKYGINELELLGIIYKLREEGFNIDYLRKNGVSYLIQNHHPDFSREITYTFQEDVTKTTRIAFIADIRAGSKSEQFKILNDMFLKFKEMGITKVFILGNLLEGLYTGKTLREYGKSLLMNDAIGQAEHFIHHFPHVEGIETYFITGKLDHTFYRELNVGEYIAGARSDLTYLGPKSCNIRFNNVLFHLEQLKNGDAYTIAYPDQKYARSLSDGEKYDAIFLSGGLNFQYFPQIRDTMIFSIPSVVDRTPKMINENKSNTIGTFMFEITYTKGGKLRRILPLISTYTPIHDDYVAIEKSPLESEDTEEKLLSFSKLYNLMHKEESFESLKKRLEVTDNELYGIITILQRMGREITIFEENGELIVCKKDIKKSSRKAIKPRMEELHKKVFGVVSDTHYGSIYSQPSMVNTFVYECYNRGITDLFHVGDICDGDYSRIRPVHNSEVFLYGATGQLEYVAKTLPRYPGMHWYGITGSHDQTHFFNYGMVFGEELARIRDDFTYLGQDRARFHYDNCTIELFHPGGGTSRILSTKPQNYQDQAPYSRRVDLSLWGHYHKNYYMHYGNTHTILLPCNVDQSSYMMKQQLPNLMGDYFVTIYYDDNGYIHYIIPEVMLFDIKDVRKRDYENPKKYIKSKIITGKTR